MLIDPCTDILPGLDFQRAIESQLTANTHSTALLRSEIVKEKAALAQDKQDLKALEEALKDTEVRRRKQAKNVRIDTIYFFPPANREKFHPLAKTMLSQTSNSNTTSDPARHMNLHAVSSSTAKSVLMSSLG